MTSHFVGWLAGCLPDLLAHSPARPPVGMAGWWTHSLAGGSASWLAGWITSHFVGWLTHSLAGSLEGWLLHQVGLHWSSSASTLILQPETQITNIRRDAFHALLHVTIRNLRKLVKSTACLIWNTKFIHHNPNYNYSKYKYQLALSIPITTW